MWIIQISLSLCDLLEFNYQCVQSCPLGTTLLGNTCSCPGVLLEQSEYCTSQCLSGYLLHLSKHCLRQCPPGFLIDSLNRSCVTNCPQDQTVQQIQLKLNDIMQSKCTCQNFTSVAGNCISSCPLQQTSLLFNICACDPALLLNNDFCNCEFFFENMTCSPTCAGFVNESTRECMPTCQMAIIQQEPKLCSICATQYLNRSSQSCQPTCTQINQSINYFQVVNFCEQIDDYKNCPAISANHCQQCADFVTLARECSLQQCTPFFLTSFNQKICLESCPFPLLAKNNQCQECAQHLESGACVPACSLLQQFYSLNLFGDVMNLSVCLQVGSQQCKFVFNSMCVDSCPELMINYTCVAKCEYAYTNFTEVKCVLQCPSGRVLQENGMYLCTQCANVDSQKICKTLGESGCILLQNDFCVDECAGGFVAFEDRVCSDLVCGYAYVQKSYYVECQAKCAGGRKLGLLGMYECTECDYLGEFDYCYELGEIGCKYFQLNGSQKMCLAEDPLKSMKVGVGAGVGVGVIIIAIAAVAITYAVKQSKVKKLKAKAEQAQKEKEEEEEKNKPPEIDIFKKVEE